METARTEFLARRRTSGAPLLPERASRRHATRTTRGAGGAKYSQNPELLTLLREAPAVFVEASPEDDVWGIGLLRGTAERHARRLHDVASSGKIALSLLPGLRPGCFRRRPWAAASARFDELHLRRVFAFVPSRRSRSAAYVR